MHAGPVASYDGPVPRLDRSLRCSEEREPIGQAGGGGVKTTAPWVLPRRPHTPDYTEPRRVERCRSGRFGAVSKTVVRASVPWVRIPPSPPELPLRTCLSIFRRLFDSSRHVGACQGVTPSTRQGTVVSGTPDRLWRPDQRSSEVHHHGLRPCPTAHKQNQQHRVLTAGSCAQLSEPQNDCGEGDDGETVAGGLLMAGGHASELLQPGKAALDQVAPGIQVPVSLDLLVRDGLFGMTATAPLPAMVSRIPSRS